MIDVTEHLSLVEWVIGKRYRRQVGGRIEENDLVQVGREGLMRAARTFNPSLGYRFTTYAVIWIDSRIRCYIRDKRRCVRVPTHVYDKGLVPPERVVYLDALAFQDSEKTIHVKPFGCEDTSFPRVLSRLDAKRLLALIRHERQRSVVSAYYIGGLTLSQIALALRLSRERVRQLREEGLRSARTALRNADERRAQSGAGRVDNPRPADLVRGRCWGRSPRQV